MTFDSREEQIELVDYGHHDPVPSEDVPQAQFEAGESSRGAAPEFLDSRAESRALAEALLTQNGVGQRIMHQMDRIEQSHFEILRAVIGKKEETHNPKVTAKQLQDQDDEVPISARLPKVAGSWNVFKSDEQRYVPPARCEEVFTATRPNARPQQRLEGQASNFQVSK